MSIKYVSELSSDGTPKLVPIANGVPEAGGQLVPSVSHYQSGTKAVPAITAWGYERIDVTLPTAMPDTDYEVTTSFASQVSNITYLGVNITDKTTTGFRAYMRNFGENAVAACTLQWQAFKLITDTTYTAMQTAVDEALPPLSDLDASSPKAVNSTAVNSAITSKAVVLAGKAGAGSLSGYRNDIDLWYQRVVDADTPANMRQLEIRDTGLRFITADNGSNWAQEWVMSPLKTLTITNKTVTLPTGGYVAWQAFTGLSTQPQLCWFRMTAISGAAADAWCTIKSSRYGAHFVFENIQTSAPLSGEITVSGTVYYM